MAFRLATAFVELTTRDGLSRGFGQARRETTQFVNDIQGQIAGLGAQISGLLGAGFAVFLAGEAEQAEVAFNTIIKNTERTRQLLKELEDLSVVTPFTPRDLREAARIALVMGTSLEEVVTHMSRLGDVAAVTNIPLSELTFIYGQIQKEGKLLLQDMRQLTTRGVPLQEELQAVLGVTEEQFRDLRSQGKITADAVTDAFKRMTDEGGIFFKGAERSSKTLFGVWSTLIGVAEQLAKKVGEELAPSLKLAATAAIALSNGLKAVNDALFGFPAVLVAVAIGLGSIALIAKVLIPILAALAGAIVTLGIGLGVLGLPLFVILAATLIAITALFWGINKIIKLITGSAKEMNEELGKTPTPKIGEGLGVGAGGRRAAEFIGLQELGRQLQLQRLEEEQKKEQKMTNELLAKNNQSNSRMEGLLARIADNTNVRAPQLAEA